MMIALVAMVMMTISVNAQSANEISSTKFNRMSSLLELRIDQVEPVKTAMAQFNSSMDAFYQLEDASKRGEAWEKILARHKATMKKVLDERQYNKYLMMLELTIKNTTERILDRQTASKQKGFDTSLECKSSLPQR